ncbi:MarR family winged helix-turn-helix transcriptional regulator [Actinoallomurus sp. CA-150999]|uniref:MarR family winged helix-turn-helix transcriptional regulator n=1 Tax=Actinoallomurus sp. CA-150999 TaxID=3239887 RepID=UPI003D9247EC
MSPPETPDPTGSATAGGTSSASDPRPASAAACPISHAIFRVARLHRMLVGQLLRRVDLHPSQELVMMHLWKRGPQRQTDLVRLLGSDAATMTRTIKRLENAGFVRRRPSDVDRRVTIVEPTPAGNALRQEVERVWVGLEDSVAEGLTAEQRTEAIKILSRIENSLARATTQHD